MEVVLDPSLGLGSGIIIPADLRQATPLPQLDPEHTTHVPAQRYLEVCQRFGFARSFIAQLYSERHERVQILHTFTFFASYSLQTFLYTSAFTGFGDRETAEALVSPVRCYGPTPDGGGSAPDEARGGGYPARLLRGGR
ncbi:hypothetical protein JCGZ_22692 [Jatropha curcas]|uniref:Uncharacterized protein n=1 Tax=Jatropha curcas TaxID=180498 RepID=A0A067K1Y4_JATCU|nr:hypothetical protein JCGZ_22692 [Jatropha curcas]